MLKSKTSKLIFALNVLWIICALFFLNLDTNIDVQVADVKSIKNDNQHQTIIVKFNDDDLIEKQIKDSKIELKLKKNEIITFKILEFKKMKKNFYQVKIQKPFFKTQDLKGELYLVLNKKILNVIYDN